jgi:hypothetical protein
VCVRPSGLIDRHAKSKVLVGLRFAARKLENILFSRPREIWRRRGSRDFSFLGDWLDCLRCVGETLNLCVFRTRVFSLPCTVMDLSEKAVFVRVEQDRGWVVLMIGEM